MSAVASFLRLDDPVNGCAVVVDNWMTVRLAAGSADCGWRIDNECPDCACEGASCGVTDIEDAPWFDPNQPGSKEFFGLYGKLSIDQPSPLTNYSVTGSTISAPLKRLTFVGALVACTARGTAFGRQWVAEQLEPLCDSCDGREGTVYLWCPDTLCDKPETPEEQTPTVEVDWSTIPGLDGCEDPVPLGPTPAATDRYDIGLRTLTDIEYVAGTFADLDDTIPACHGSRVTFQFALRNPRMFVPATESCLMKPPATGQVQPCCAPIRWGVAPEVVQCGCPVECGCPIEAEPSTEDDGLFSIVADGAAACRYSTPLCSKTFACLTDVFSASYAVPTITISAGLKPLRNMSITMWEARHGLPNPSTSVGFEVYQNIDPIVEPALIGYLAAQSTLTLDGRGEREWVVCPGGNREPQAADVVRCGNRKYRHPTLCCGTRYWVGVEIECADVGDDWQVVTEISGI